MHGNVNISHQDRIERIAGRRLPRCCYHLVDADNLESIKRDGLLCASRLLGRAGLDARSVKRSDREQRRVRTCLPDGTILRDQVPMPPSALERCLVDALAPGDWYALLNSMVFFWLDPERLNRQARAARSSPQLIFEIDTQALLARHVSRAFVTPFNTGNARRRPARRGRATFVPYSTWLRTGWMHEAASLGLPPRSASHAPVELTVSDSVPDIMQYVLEIRPIDASN
jgi:ssDNA thymidine ADP-ribosyltransferase, DarT